MEQKKIRYKDLSIALKVATIGGIAFVVEFVILFMIGFFSAI